MAHNGAKSGRVNGFIKKYGSIRFRDKKSSHASSNSLFNYSLSTANPSGSIATSMVTSQDIEQKRKVRRFIVSEKRKQMVRSSSVVSLQRRRKTSDELHTRRLSDGLKEFKVHIEHRKRDEEIVMIKYNPSMTMESLHVKLCLDKKLTPAFWAIRLMDGRAPEKRMAMCEILDKEIRLIEFTEKNDSGIVIVRTFKDLSSEIQRIVSKAGITELHLANNQHLPILLNCINFRHHTQLLTEAQAKNTAKQPVRAGPVGAAPLVTIPGNPREKYDVTCRKTDRLWYASTRDASRTQIVIKKVATNQDKAADWHKTAQFYRFCSNHRNFPQLNCVFQSGREAWLVMTRNTGGTIKDALDVRVRFQEDEIAYVADQMLRGLAFLHANNMVHMNLRGSNVLLTFDGTVKLIGLTNMEDISGGGCTHMIGSPFYMAPEVVAKKYRGSPADIWSFGITLIEMARRQPPNASSTIRAMFTAGTVGVQQPFKPQSRWSTAFCDFLSKKVLRFKQDDRSTAEELLTTKWVRTAAPVEKMARLFRDTFHELPGLHSQLRRSKQMSALF